MIKISLGKLLIFILTFSLVLTACGEGNDGSSSNGTAAVGSSTKPIKIGLSVETSGAVAEGGNNISNSIQVAAEIINESGGIKGRQIELVVRDTEGNPTRGVSIIRDFADKEKVVGVLGGYLTTVMLAQGPMIKEAELPFMVVTSIVPEVINDGLPWTFGTRMEAEKIARVGFDFIKKTYDTDKIAILHEDGGYGQGTLKAMESVLSQEGTTPAAVESFHNSDKDMTAQVTKAREKGAEAIYLVGIGASSGYVLKAMEKIGWNVPVIGDNGLVQKALWEVAGKTAEGIHVIQTANFNVEQERPMAQEFLKRYTEKFGQAPTISASSAQAFDGAMLMFKALENIELTDDMEKDREALKKALENLAGPVEGTIQDYVHPFSAEDRDALDINSYNLNTWLDGKLVRAEE